MSVASSISAAMDAVASKKEQLHKAFLELQSHSSALVNFTVQWKELEDHFDNLDKLMQKRFEELGGKEKENEKGNEKENEKEKKPAAEKTTGKPNKAPPAEKSSGNPKKTTPALEDEVKPRPRLKSLCEKMDGKGLKKFLIDSQKDLDALRKEIPAALRYAADPAKLVLQSLEGFYPSGDGGKTSNADLLLQRRVCDVLLESLPSVLSPDEVSSEAKKDAQKIATTWKSKLSLDADFKNGASLETKALLQLLASYGISKEFKEDDIIDLVIRISRRREIPELCRALQISDKIPDVVEKLSSSGRQIDAVHFVFKFGLAEKFPPVPLLKAYLKEAKRAALELAKNDKNPAGAQNNADSKEIASLKSIIKCIEEHKLESQMSPENLEKRVAQLEKAIANRKRSAGAVKSQSTNKRPRVNSGGGVGGGGAAGASTVGTGTTSLLPTPGVASTTSLHAKPNPLLATPNPLLPTANPPNAFALSKSAPNPLLPTANPPNAFAPSKSADFYRPPPVSGIPSYNLPGQGVYDRASQGIYQSSYGVGSNPVPLSRSHLYPSDNLQSSLYGAGPLGGSTNYGSYNIGSGVPPANSYQSSYLR